MSDDTKYTAVERDEFPFVAKPKAIKRNTASEENFTLNIDLSQLNTEQRKELRARLQDFARGLGPELGMVLASEGDPHLSHGDSDGWI